MKISYIVEGRDEMFTFYGEEARRMIQLISNFVPLSLERVGHYLPELGITIKSLDFEDN